MYDPEYYTVGELAKTYNIPVSTLRFYDKQGIFVPEYRNPENGYRYYSSDQLLRLDLILFLRELGVSTKQIPKFLEQATSREALRSALARHREEICGRIADLQGIVDKLDDLENTFETFDFSAGDLEIKELPARYIHCNPAKNLPTDGPGRRFRFRANTGSGSMVCKASPAMVSMGTISSLSDFRHSGVLLCHTIFQEYVLENPPVSSLRETRVFPAGRYLTIRFFNAQGERLRACRALLHYIDQEGLETDDTLIESVVGTHMPPVTEEEELWEFQVHLKE